MRYASTRGEAAELGFADVLLEGLARDGGLFVPSSIPALADPAPHASYQRLATEVIVPYVEGDGGVADLSTHVEAAYEFFDDPDDVVPLVGLGGGRWVQELFH